MAKFPQRLKLSVISLMLLTCTMGILSGCGEKQASVPQKSWIETNPIIQAFLHDFTNWNASNKRRLIIEYGWIFTPQYKKPAYKTQNPTPPPYLTETLTDMMKLAFQPKNGCKRIQPEYRNRIFEGNKRRRKTELVTAGTVKHFNTITPEAFEQLSLAQWVQHKQQSHGLKSSLAVYEPTEPVTFGQFCQWSAMLLNLHKPSVNPQAVAVAEDDAPLTNELQQYYQAYEALRQAHRLPTLTAETKILDLLQQPMSRVDLLLLAIPLAQQTKAFQVGWQQGIALPVYTEEWQPANADPLATIDHLSNWQELSETHQAVLAWAYYQGWLGQWFGVQPESLKQPGGAVRFEMQAVLTQAEVFESLRTLTQSY